MASQLHSPSDLKAALNKSRETAQRDASATGRLSDAEFAEVAALVGRLTGIVIKEHKREMIHSRLARRLRALNLPTFKDYLAFVASPAGEQETGELINAVTTNLTSFFRENHHFEDLRDRVLTPLIASGGQRLRIWSSACSSGEEPYSIAMTALATPGFDRIRDAKLLATDLDTNILARAQRGVYPMDRAAQAPNALIDRFTKPASDGCEFTPEVKAFITFRQLNLLHDWPMSGPFDVIFCRNVLIYFDTETKRSIVDRMAHMIRIGGTLYLGHSESLLGEHPLLKSEGQTIYRRVS